MLAGSGTGLLLVICPWTVVIPLFEAGGTRFSGLLVMAYVMPPMVTDVVVKLTTPEPELEALNVPLKVAAKLSLPAIGTVCVIVSVKVPEAPMTPLPETKVWKFPKLEPVGVFKLVDPRPVNVIMRALPAPPRKVTELVPLPAHPTHVKVPDVVNVTGSACASEVVSMAIATSTALMKVILKKFVIFTSLWLPSHRASVNHPRRQLPSTRRERTIFGSQHSVYGLIVSTATGQMPLQGDKKART